jgi:hypothetical protein
MLWRRKRQIATTDVTPANSTFLHLVRKVNNAYLHTEIIILHLQVIQKNTGIIPWALLKILSLRLSK